MKRASRNELLFLIVALSHASHITATSLVYSMRLRRSLTAPVLFGNQPRTITSFSSVPIYSQRSRHIVDSARAIDICESRKIVGDVLNMRHTSKKLWWIEVTTALADEWFSSQGTSRTSASRFGLDDIVVEAGRVIRMGKNWQFVYYGLAGFPTSWRPSLNETQDPLVGTKLFSLGAGIELSYSAIINPQHAVVFVFQNRFIHFFNRTWQPILPCGGKIQPGNVTDLLFSVMYRFSANVVEAGYNPTFFTNQAVITNNQKISTESFVRNGAYVRYAHLMRDFWAEDKHGFVGAGFSLARASRFNSRIHSAWLAIGGLF